MYTFRGIQAIAAEVEAKYMDEVKANTMMLAVNESDLLKLKILVGQGIGAHSILERLVLELKEREDDNVN